MIPKLLTHQNLIGERQWAAALAPGPQSNAPGRDPKIRKVAVVAQHKQLQTCSWAPSKWKGKF
jgi:hypothetical protein